MSPTPSYNKAVQREELIQSANLYAKAGNTPKAANMLEKFVETNPTPLAAAEEARQHLAEYAQRSGNVARRDYWYHETIRADEQAGPQRTDRTHYLAAKAQLALAQPAREAFRAVRL